MKDFLLGIKNNLLDLWQKTTKMQKAVVLGTAFLIVLAFTFFVNNATTPDYRPLFTNLDETSAANAITKLKDQKISYQLKNSGKDIWVPAKNVDEQRIQLVSDGTASGGVVDFSIFDKTQFGETDQDRQVKFLRALQGELTRTIEKFPEVENARVHIVMPEATLFEEKQKDTTAAVWLKIKTGQTMKDGQINGLIKLVSSSVEGLKPQNITVVDTIGNVLSGKYNADSESQDTQQLSTTQLQLQQKNQDYYQNNIQTMLDKVLGPGQSVVRVQVELDLDKVKKSSIQHNGNKVVVSEDKSSSTSKGTTAQGGVPGTPSNVNGGTTYQSTDSSGQNESENKHNISNYDVDKTTENRLQNPGSVKRMSVAVVFNGEVDQKKQKSIEDVVTNAAGIDQQRGDSISVVAMPFNTKYADEVKSAMAKAEQMKQLETYGGLGLAILVVAIIAFVVYRRRKTEDIVTEEEIFPVDVNELDGFIDNLPKERELTAEEKEKLMAKEQVEKVATQNPADVAALLKTWLTEE